MRLSLFQVDAFSGEPFTGNPAAVCPLDYWLDDPLLQHIAAENNLSETAFFVPVGTGYHIRWFTPITEVRLCGHATLAAAFVLFNELGCVGSSIEFHSASGILRVSRRDTDHLTLDLPSQVPQSCVTPLALERALDCDVLECFVNSDLIAIVDSSKSVKGLTPDFPALLNLDVRGTIVTAVDCQYDFVCRFFGPRVGINEDPVTGYAFTKLVPLWSSKLNKRHMFAKQVSQRGGEVTCELRDERVLLTGRARLYLRGEILV